MRQYFPPGQSVLLSVPIVGNLSINQAQFLDITQGTLHNAVSWPFLMSRPKFGSSIDSNTFLLQSYILFLWPDEHNLISDDSVDSQLDSLSWNLRGRFIILIPDIGSESPVKLSLRIDDIFWT